MAITETQTWWTMCTTIVAARSTGTPVQPMAWNRTLSILVGWVLFYLQSLYGLYKTGKVLGKQMSFSRCGMFAGNGICGQSLGKFVENGSFQVVKCKVQEDCTLNTHVSAEEWSYQEGV